MLVRVINTWAVDRSVNPPILEDLVSIGGVRIDGSINLRYDIGKWELGSGDYIEFYLAHVIKTDPSGHSRSEMVVSGLDSFTVPDGRYRLRSVCLGGLETIFNAERLGGVFAPIGDGSYARRTLDAALEIKTANGWKWRFQDGRLIDADSPGLLRMSVVDAIGGRVSSLRATRLGGYVGSLQASYDEGGRIKALEFGPHRHRFWYSGEKLQLATWVAFVAGKVTEYNFEYKNDLLVRVTRDRVVEVGLEWAKVRGGLTADSEWPFPVRVSELGRCSYSYHLDHKGYSIKCKDRTTGLVRCRVVNTSRGTIDVIEEGAVLRRIYFGTRRGSQNAGRVTRIENGQGAIIEKYEYDDLGRVVSYWKDDQEIEFFDVNGGRREP